MKPETISIDGTDYVRADSLPAPKPAGNREVVVCERGWIFVGNVTEDDTYLRLAKVSNLRKWKSGGFGGALLSPQANGVELDKAPDMSIRIAAVLFRLPVAEDWAQ